MPERRQLREMHRQPEPRSAEPSYEELEDLLRIDEHNLSDSRRTHSELFHRVGKQYKRALSRRDEAKLILKRAEAEIDGMVRDEAAAPRRGRNGDDKPQRITEKEVESQKILHPTVRNATDQLLECEQELGMWEALKESYEQRGYALRDLIRLYLAEYFSVNLDGDGRPDRDERQFREVQVQQAKREIQDLRQRRSRD